MNTLGEAQLDAIEAKVVNEKGVSVVKRYEKGRFLGKGGFAKCFELKDLETGKVLAAKIIDKLSLNKERSKQKLASEINIHKSLKHPGVVRFESTFEDSTNVYILLELCPNQTLKELVKRRKRLTELEAQCYLSQLVPTLKYLHESNVIHRDLKLGNLFLGKNMELKIGDFGLAAKLANNRERRKTVCGTPNYIAPEILNSRRNVERAGHSFEVDIWAVGIILYTMLVGKPPFETNNMRLTYKKIRANEYRIPPEAELSPEAISLIQRVLVHIPEKRPKLDEIMNDPFLTKNPIPRTMPILTLASPPIPTYVTQYSAKTSAGEQLRVAIVLEKTASTAKFGSTNVSGVTARLKADNFAMTGHNLIRSSSNNFVKPIVNSERGPSKQKRPVTSAVCSPATTTLQDPFQPVYVAVHLDYTERYGVGYMLTNGTMGFFFNDMSNLLLLRNRTQYAYSDWYLRRPKEPTVKVCGVTEYPKELEKKVRIFLQFRQWYDANKREAAEQALAAAPSAVSEPEERLGVKKVVKTNSGLLFRLNDHIVQMCFNDMSEMVVSFRSKQLIMINKKGERQMLKVSEQMFQGTNEGVVQRFRYVLHLVSSLNAMHRGGAVSATTKLKTFRLNPPHK